MSEALDVLSATEAAIAEAGDLSPIQAARAALLQHLANALHSCDEGRDVPKLASEWRAALKEFEQSAPRKRSFRDELKDAADG